MRDNQKPFREEFEKHINNLTADEISNIIPKTITYPGGDCFSFWQTRYTNERGKYFDYCKYYVNTFDNQNGEDEVILVNFEGDDKVRNMIMRLFDNGHLSDYLSFLK